MKQDKKMSQKSRKKMFIESFIIGLANGILGVGVLCLVAAFFLVYINTHIEAFKELPPLILFFLPIGLIGIFIRVLGWRYI